MMALLIDLTGKRFGRLTVQGVTSERRGPQPVWMWICDCGAAGKSQGRHLRNGAIKSCGCLRRDRAATVGRSMKGKDVVDAPTYYGMHTRLYRRLGAAKEHRCVDCSEQAAHWSYDGSDPNEMTERQGGWALRYSTLLEHYQPRCRYCHAALDRWADRRWGNV